MFIRLLFLALAFIEILAPIEAQRTKAELRSAKEVWAVIKRALLAPDGEEYFKENLSGTMIPGGAGGVDLFTGTLLSAEPAAQPGVLVVAISDGITGEATLRFKDSEWKDTHLSGPLLRGSIIQFEGVPTSFTKEPFMLTLEVSIAHRTRSLKVARQSR
jgi:hypothetical protein